MKRKKMCIKSSAVSIFKDTLFKGLLVSIYKEIEKWQQLLMDK